MRHLFLFFACMKMLTGFAVPVQSSLFMANHLLEKANTHYAGAKYAIANEHYQAASSIFYELEECEAYYESQSALIQSLYTSGEFKKAYTKVDSLLIEISARDIKYRIKAFHHKGKILTELVKYEEALSFFESALRLQNEYNKADLLSFARIYNSLGFLYRKQKSIKKAKECLDKALSFWKGSGASEQLLYADIQFNLGAVAYLTSDFTKAKQQYKEVLSIRKAVLGDIHPTVADCLDNLGALHKRLDNYEESLKRHEEALDIRIQTFGKQHIKVVSSYNNIACTYYILGDVDSALRFFTKAFDIQEALNYSLATGHSNIAVMLKEKGYLEESLEHSLKALALRIKNFGEESSDAGASYNNVGSIFWAKKDYTTALIYLKKAHDIRQTIYGEFHYLVLASYNNLGYIYADKKDFKNALCHHFEALDISLKLFGDQHTKTASCYEGIGNTYYKMGAYEEALFYLNEAILVRKRLEEKEHLEEMKNIHVAPLYLARANTLAQLGKYAAALNQFHKTTRIYRSVYGEQHPELANCLKSIAVVYRKIGNRTKALSYLSKAAFANNFEEQPLEKQDVEAIPIAYMSPIYLLETLHAEADILEELYLETGLERHLKKAFERYLLCNRLIDSLRHRHQNQEDRMAFNKSALAIYEGAIRTCHFLKESTKDQHYERKAFHFMERSKMNALLTDMLSDAALKNGIIPDSLAALEKKMKADIDFLERRLIYFKEQGEQKNIELNKRKLANKQLDYHQFIQQLEVDFPRYYDFKYKNQTPSIQAIQETLESSAAVLIEYFVGDKDLFVFKIGKHDFSLEKLPKPRNLSEKIAQLRAEFLPSAQRPSVMDSCVKRDIYETTSFELYQAIFEPLFAEDEQPEEVVIIPDGVLNFIPFDALLTEFPEGIGWHRSYSYLLRKQDISYAFSATLLLEMRNRVARPYLAKELLAVAPSFEREFRAMPNGESIYLRPLTSSQIEVNNIRDGVKPLNTRLLKGVYATKEAYLRYYKNAFAIHLSSHAIANDANPRLSGIYFTRGEGMSTENSFLSLGEIFNHRIQAELVFLSACETGVGELHQGEGLYSLSRAFTFAGAKSLVATLWSVNDKQTMEVVTLFYKELAKGKSKSRALAQAKREYLKEGKAHPFYWAAHLPIGDMQPLLSDMLIVAK